MSKKQQPDQRKARVKTSAGQVPNPGQKANTEVNYPK
ncbi:hypothetical protein Ccel_0206 [Ruminiclostridium cellulolyticum H10]|uniref:Uncharacterized protein n=1 Tax=Ruminiclostridium cellulolyticum (strain ATCC 35319 / DSM 5812 / JCM 6584 / H10) TaxID=394503 RepID=B8I513_RUMCH|nr:hypothetical protein Ccel_0206 [Ruminiclostridium cellulolyticum H10]